MNRTVKLILILLSFVGCSLISGLGISVQCMAQEYEVLSFELALKDLTARAANTSRLDGNGRKCAVLKVYVNDNIAEARGSVVGDIKTTGMEKMIYMADGSRKLELVFDNHYPLTINFIDYDYPTVSEQMTYVVKLKELQSVSMATAVPATVDTASDSVALEETGISDNEEKVQSANEQLAQTVGEAILPVESGPLGEAVKAYNDGDYEKALSLLNNMVDDDRADFLLGEMFLYGKGVKKDETIAINWYGQSAVRGNAQGQRKLADMYYQGSGIKKDLEQAFGWYGNSAEQGDSEAQWRLGYMYENGQGVSRDYAEAANWYRRSAANGNATAQYRLGQMYENGRGVAQDYAEVANWYRKSADKGNSDAQFRLGEMYENGHGVPQDYNEAINWYRKSADQGNAEGQYRLGRMYENGHGVSQDYAEAISWYRKSADQGNAEGQYGLGHMYENGHGVSQDYAEAARWYLKGADQGNADCQYELGRLYEYGKGVSKDGYKAEKWYRKSAGQRHAMACFRLARMYESGKDIRNDPNEAMRWYQKAKQLLQTKAEQGDASSQYYLGFMYEGGKDGKRKNEAEAIKWYRRSAAQGDERALQWLKSNNLLN